MRKVSNFISERKMLILTYAFLVYLFNPILLQFCPKREHSVLQTAILQINIFSLMPFTLIIKSGSRYKKTNGMLTITTKVTSGVISE